MLVHKANSPLAMHQPLVVDHLPLVQVVLGKPTKPAAQLARQIVPFATLLQAEAGHALLAGAAGRFVARQLPAWWDKVRMA